MGWPTEVPLYVLALWARAGPFDSSTCSQEVSRSTPLGCNFIFFIEFFDRIIDIGMFSLKTIIINQGK
jgi:hypothetical protein